MAATYVPALRGYIADVPWFYFRRGDGTVFTNKHVTQCSLSPQSDFQEVRAGWSQYATAYIPGQATMDVNITFGDFDQDLFSIFNGTDFAAENAFEVPNTELLTIGTDHKVTLAYTPVEHSVFVRGMEEGSGTTPAAGTFVVDTENKTVTFTEDEVGEIEVTYNTIAGETTVANIDNTNVACGEVVLKWPKHRWAA